MTKTEAQDKCREGNKITHHYFTDSEFIEFRNDKFYFEDGVEVPETWWRHNMFQDGFLIKEN